MKQVTLIKNWSDYWISLEEVDKKDYQIKRVINLTKEVINDLMENPSKVKEYFN